MTLFNSEKIKATLIISAFFFLAYWLTLVNGGVYMDDVITSGWNQDLESLLLTYREIGWFMYWPAFLHKLFFLPGNFYGLALERWAIFAAYLAAALLLHRTLLRSALVSAQEALFLSIVFAIIPVNTARIAVSNLNYAFSYALFWGGLFLACEYVTAGGRWRRVLSLALFFVSFSTNSLLFFYGAAFVLIVYLYLRQRGGLAAWRKVISLADYLLLPFLFWVLLKMFFRPYGNYAAQNTMSPETVWGAFETAPMVLEYLKLLFKQSLALIKPWMVLAAVPVIYKVCALGAADEKKPGLKRDFSFLVLGAVLLFMGAFPYVAVGKYPQLDSWNSRHALLLPLGLSFLLVFGARLASAALRLPSMAAGLICSFFIAGFLNYNHRVYSRFEREWVKQQAIAEAFKSAPEAGTFIIEDRTKKIEGHFQESYRWYYWTALIYAGKGDRKSVGLNIARAEIESAELSSIGERYRSQYFADKYSSSAVPEYKTLIDFGERRFKVGEGVARFFSLLAGPDSPGVGTDGLLRVSFERAAKNKIRQQ